MTFTEDKKLHTKDEFLDSLSRYNPYLCIITVLMSLNWGLSGMFLVAPAYISPTESNQTFEGYVKIGDEFSYPKTFYGRPEFVASAFSVGNLILGPMFAWIADLIGRKPVIIASIATMGIVGIANSFAINYEMLLALRMIQGSVYFATTIINWVLVSESTSKRAHAKASVLFGLSWIFGSALVAPVAILFPDWRKTLFVLSIPNVILAVVLFFVLHESIEFTLVKGHTRAAEKFIHRVIKFEKNYTCEYDIDSMIKSAQASKKTSSSLFSFVKVICTNMSFTKLLLISFYMSFTSTLLHNAMALTSTVIEVGNLHWNFVLSSLVEIPSYLLVPPLFKKFGALRTVLTFHILTAVACAGVVLVTQAYYIPYLTFWLMAKFACSSAFMCFIIYSAQMFMLEFRSLSLGWCSTIGNIGAVLAPQCVLLDTIRPSLMFIVFGSAAAVAAVLTIFLPRQPVEHYKKNKVADSNS